MGSSIILCDCKSRRAIDRRNLQAGEFQLTGKTFLTLRAAAKKVGCWRRNWVPWLQKSGIEESGWWSSHVWCDVSSKILALWRDGEVLHVGKHCGFVGIPRCLELDIGLGSWMHWEVEQEYVLATRHLSDEGKRETWPELLAPSPLESSPHRLLITITGHLETQSMTSHGWPKEYWMGELECLRAESEQDENCRKCTENNINLGGSEMRSGIPTSCWPNMRP